MECASLVTQTGWNGMKNRFKMQKKILFHGDCFCRTDIHTGATVYTKFTVYYCLAIFHSNSGSRTLIDAGFTPGTFIFINNCGH